MSNKIETPMQELISWMEEVGAPSGIIKKAKKQLQKEKQQIIGFAENCLDRALDLDIRTAYSNIEKYFSETYQ